MIITLYIILFYYEKIVVKFYNCIKQIIKNIIKKVVKFYNCIKQIIKKIIKKWWLNFIYSELKLRQLKTSLLTYNMASEFFSMDVNCDSYI